jgi:hypothetical protein
MPDNSNFMDPGPLQYNTSSCKQSIQKKNRKLLIVNSQNILIIQLTKILQYIF